jgi:DUF4097 and DUF4098 domain-containing protein YvlB
MRFALALAFAFLLTGCDIEDFDNYQSDFHYRYDLQPGARFEIENANGSVEIEGWDRNAVDISGVKFASRRSSLDAIRIDIRNSPNSIDIRTVRMSSWGGGARYTIRVPRQTILDRVESSNGSILLRDIESSQTASLRTSNGPIRAENIHGAIDAHTSNGRIELSEISGAITMRTSNGSIDLRLRNEHTEPIRAETSNGSITLRLPADTGAHLRADTTHGGVSTEFDVGEHVRNHTLRNNFFDGTLGKGGPEIELTTRNGNISILKNI